MDLVDQRDAAVLAGFDGREVRRHQRVLLGQRAAVEGARGIDHVDDAVAHRVGLLEHADGLGAAAHVDLDTPSPAALTLSTKLRKLCV
jgi:diphthamide biosynthesis methyltransferase